MTLRERETMYLFEYIYWGVKRLISYTNVPHFDSLIEGLHTKKCTSWCNAGGKEW